MIATSTLVIVSIAALAPQTANPAPIEYVEIDGSKNPELIPEWSAWEFAFRTIAGGSKLIPTEILLHVSSREAESILEAAMAHEERDRACQARVKRVPSAAEGSVEKMNELTRDIQIQCRWQTLHARDRLLDALGQNPAGQQALVRWVESTKVTTRVTVPKAELAHYRRPQ